MANVTFNLLAPSGYSPQLVVRRKDTLATLGTVTMTETAADGYYAGVIDVGSFTGDVIGSLTSPSGVVVGRVDGASCFLGDDNNSGVLAQILAKTNLIGTGAGAIVETRVSPKGFIAFVGEVDSQTLPTVNLTSETIEIVFEDTAKKQIAVIANSNVTRTANTVTFTKPAAVTASVRRLSYSIRRVSDKYVFHYGIADIQSAALVRN